MRPLSNVIGSFAKFGLTTVTSYAILMVKKEVLPVDGRPSKISYRITALFGRRGGYFCLLAPIKRPITPMITKLYVNISE